MTLLSRMEPALIPTALHDGQPQLFDLLMVALASSCDLAVDRLMDEPSNPTPLVNDAAREAVDSLRGYSYQMLRSIETWLDLGPGEILVLEGAEDLDRVGLSGATVEQVKDTAGSGGLTLRNPNALAAIGHFWEHCQRNPSTAIQFRYLTTSGIGRERGDDLGLARPALEIWRDIRRSPMTTTSMASASVIQNYLSARDEFPHSFREFLVSAPVGDFISRIIQPFEWVTSQPVADVLCRRIETRLIELGETRRIGAADAADALAALHLEAWRNATDHDREPLRRGDFLRILDAAGTSAVPNDLMFNLFRQAMGQGAGQAAIPHADVRIGKPPLYGRRFARPGLEEGIREALLDGPVQIHGSTGMGKTVLAAAIVPAMGAIGWIDLRDLDRNAALTRLQSALSFVKEAVAGTTIVLDDFDPGDDPRAFAPALSELATSLKRSGGALLITSGHRLPPRLATAIDISGDHILVAPSFEAEEIAAYFAEAGCPDEAADTWAKIVLASTSGHPQLVDARLSALQQQNWPKPSIGEWMAPTIEIVDVRAEARRMVSALPEDERELLCRASLVIGRISRLRLQAIGGIFPAVKEPGHIVDRLIGPWLEVTDTSDLRVSPLLRGLGTDTRTPSWNMDMHASIAWAWLADPSLDAGDVSTLLMHAIIAKQIGPLLHILPSLLEAPAEVWQQIGETARIFTMMAIDENDLSLFPAAVDRAVFRILQLRIAVEAQKEEIPAIIKRALQESERRAADDLATDFFDFLFLWQVLRLDTVTHDVPFLLSLGIRFRQAAEKVGNGLLRLEQQGGDVQVDFPDLSPIFSLTLAHSLADSPAFGRFLDIVEPLAIEDRRFILPGRSGDLDAASVMLDRLWLSEIDRPERDWDAFAALLERTIAIALKAEMFSLVDSAAALLVRVTDEDLKDARSALSIANRTASRIANPVRVLAAKGKVFYRLEDTASALEIYQQILPALDVSASYRAGIWRDAALSAAQAKLWPMCASRFVEGLAALADEDPIERHVGFGFDCALALYLSGEFRAAVDAFSRALDLILEDGRELPPEPFLSVRQYGSEAMKRVYANASQKKQDNIDVEAIVGRSSAIETLGWEQNHPASIALLAWQLLDLQLLAPGYDRVSIDRLAELIRRSRDVAVVATNWETLTRLAIVTSDLEPLVCDLVRGYAYFGRLLQLRDAGEAIYQQLDADPPVPPLSEAAAVLIICWILAVIVALMAKDSLQLLPLRRWQEDLPADENYDRLRDFLSQAEDRLFRPNDPWDSFAKGEPTADARILSALGALTRNRTAAELLTAQAMVAYDLNPTPMAAFVAEPLSEIVTRSWEHLCEVPALLAMPRLSVPQIRTAISSTPAGWRRIQSVLRSALTAIPNNTARDLRRFIDALQDR